MDHHFLHEKHIRIPSLTPEQQEHALYFDRAMRLRAKADPEYAARLEAQREARAPAPGPRYEHFSVYNAECMQEVVTAIEPPAMRQAYDDWQRYRNRPDRFEVLYNEREYLLKQKEWVPVPEADDFRDAIRQAYLQHQCATDRHRLYQLYGQYSRALRKGTAFMWDDQHRPHDTTYHKDRYVAVRRHLGLSADLSFLDMDQLP